MSELLSFMLNASAVIAFFILGFWLRDQLQKYVEDSTFHDGEDEMLSVDPIRLQMNYTYNRWPFKGLIKTIQHNNQKHAERMLKRENKLLADAMEKVEQSGLTFLKRPNPTHNSYYEVSLIQDPEIVLTRWEAKAIHEAGILLFDPSGITLSQFYYAPTNRLCQFRLMACEYCGGSGAMCYSYMTGPFVSCNSQACQEKRLQLLRAHEPKELS